MNGLFCYNNIRYFWIVEEMSDTEGGCKFYEIISISKKMLAGDDVQNVDKHTVCKWSV